MIGDTNLFLMSDADEKTAEIEIMIAESSFHRSGRGRESTLLMLKYGYKNYYIRKINIVLFKKDKKQSKNAN